MHNKRALLLLATGTLAGLVAFVGSAPINAAVGENEAHRVVGSWTVVVTPLAPPAPPIINFSAFTSDGLLINANETGATAIGNWAKATSRQVDTTFSGFQVFGSQTFRYTVRGSLELSLDGETMDGKFVNDIFDANGTLIASITGTVHATRLHVEPLQ